MIIGFAGKAGSGKDTAFKYLHTLDPSVRRVAFGDKVKECLAALLGIEVHELEMYKNDPTCKVAIGWENEPTLPQERMDELVEQMGSDKAIEYVHTFAPSKMWSPMTDPITLRHAMQRVGTEVGREIIGQTLGIDLWPMLALPPNSYDPDRDNIIITDVRFQSEVEYIQKLGGYVVLILRNESLAEVTHQSEELKIDYNYQIPNNGTLEEFYDELYRLLHLVGR